jgi:hypothetical protein
MQLSVSGNALSKKVFTSTQLDGNAPKVTAAFFGISISLLPIWALGADANAAGAASLLASANYYAQRYNWKEAAGYFSRAARLHEANGDKRNALYAKIGFLRGTMESADLPQLSAHLRKQLENPLVANDDRLKLFCFSAKGMLTQKSTAPRRKRTGNGSPS